MTFYDFHSETVANYILGIKSTQMNIDVITDAFRSEWSKYLSPPQTRHDIIGNTVVTPCSNQY